MVQTVLPLLYTYRILTVAILLTPPFSSSSPSRPRRWSQSTAYAPSVACFSTPHESGNGATHRHGLSVGLGIHRLAFLAQRCEEFEIVDLLPVSMSPRSHTIVCVICAFYPSLLGAQCSKRCFEGTTYVVRRRISVEELGLLVKGVRKGMRRPRRDSHIVPERGVDGLAVQPVEAELAFGREEGFVVL